jgi:mRNA interferase MazF
VAGHRLTRGDVWTAAGGAAYTRKPRPVVVIQDDRFDATSSVTICPLTSDPEPLPLFRVTIEPADSNGLRARSFVMADKISTVQRANLARRIGRLNADEMSAVERAILIFLGFSGESR